MKWPKNEGTPANVAELVALFPGHLHLHCRRKSLSFVLHGAMMSED